MTQSSYFLTNGSSLEDCHTNFFALADLCGIKWRTYTCDNNYNDITDDPILNSYSKCLLAEHLCVWRRVRTNTQEPHHQHRTIGDSVYVNYTKELWIFWYGQDPNFAELLTPNLKDCDSGTWETPGISYECRTLIFKALHNLIERCLLSRGYARLGKWFLEVKPCDSRENKYKSDKLNEETQVTFAFNFFLHGDSHVCGNIDVRQHSAVYRLTKDDVQAASLLPGGVRVILAPYGLQGYFSGNVLKDTDPSVQKFLADWKRIYPLMNVKSRQAKENFNIPTSTGTNNPNTSNDTDDADAFLNKVIEVNVGDYRMKYPCCYVFITATDRQFITARMALKNGKLNSASFSGVMETIMKKSDSALENNKLLMTPYYQPRISDTYFLKNITNQTIHFSDITLLNRILFNRQEAESSSAAFQYCDVLLHKDCHCAKCQGSMAKKLKTNNALAIKGNKHERSFEKEKMKYFKQLNLFHHRTQLNLSQDIETFLLPNNNTNSSSLDNNEAATNNSGGSNQPSLNQSNVTPLMMNYKSPVSTSTSSLLNTPGVEASPMSNFNIDGNEHISPMNNQSREENNLMNTPTNMINPSPRGKMGIEIRDSPTVPNMSCDNNGGGGLIGGNNIANNNRLLQSKLNLNVQVDVKPTIEACSMLENEALLGEGSSSSNNNNNNKQAATTEDTGRSKRLCVFESNYDDLDHDLRAGHLYDFSNEADNWNDSLPKSRKYRSNVDRHDFRISKQFLETFFKNEFSHLNLNFNSTDLGNSASSMPANNNESMPSTMDNNQHFTSLADNGTNNLRQSSTHLMNGGFQGNVSTLRNNQHDDNCHFDTGIFNSPEDSTDNNNFNAPPQTTSSKMDANIGTPDLGAMFLTPPPSSETTSPVTLDTNCNNRMDMDGGEKSKTSTNVSIETVPKDGLLIYRRPQQSTFVTAPRYSPLDNLEFSKPLPSSLSYKYNTAKRSQPSLPSLPSASTSNFLSYSSTINSNHNQTNSVLSSLGPTLPSTTLVAARSRTTTNQAYDLMTPTRVSQHHQQMIRAPQRPTLVSPMMNGMMHRATPGLINRPRMHQFNDAYANNNSNNFRPNSSMLGGGGMDSPQVGNNYMQNSAFPYPQPTTPSFNSGPNPNGMMGNNNNNNVGNNFMLDPYRLAPRVPPLIGPPTTGGNMHFQPQSATAIDKSLNAMPASECNSLMLNLLLSDSMFNLYRDHNFESCSICVCNMNIKGNDVGIYLPDPSVGQPQQQQQQQQANSYDHEVQCTCGFSALTNRHMSQFTGLFYEDETEITRIHYEPTAKAICDVEESTLYDKDLRKILNDIDENFVNLLITQSTNIFSACSTLSRVVHWEAQHVFRTYNIQETSYRLFERDPAKLVFRDGAFVALISLIMTRLDQSSGPNNLLLVKPGDSMLKTAARPVLHEWAFRKSVYPTNSHETIYVLRSLQPLMKDSIERKAINDVTYNSVQGPLTWRQFHSLAGRSTEYMCEPQPIPSLLAGNDRDGIIVSPFAVRFWEKLSLEPYAISRDIGYVVITPNDDYILSCARNFFKELSATYELLKLGHHAPITKIFADGICPLGVGTVKSETGNNNPLEEWMAQLGESPLAGLLKAYGQACFSMVGQLSNYDKSLFEQQPGKSGGGATFEPNNCSGTNNPSSSQYNNVGTSINNHTSSYHNAPNNNNTSSTSGNNILSQYNSISQQRQQPMQSSTTATSTGYNHLNNNNNNNESMVEVKPLNDSIDSHASSTVNMALSKISNTITTYDDNDDIHHYPGIVVYIIEPFSCLDKESAKLGSVGLFKMFAHMLTFIPENLRSNIHLQLVSIDSVVSGDKDIRNVPRYDQMKSLCFSVYSLCKQLLTIRPNNIKSLTGLGPAASFENFLKDKELHYNITELYTTPFILAPIKDKQSELGEMFGDRREKTQTMFCAYCLSEDQKWLIASCTNDKGDILQTKIINIHVPNRLVRRTATVRRYGLNKMMKFLQTVMSESVTPWRLVIGRLGRIGHGELKEWTFLLSKKSLLKYSRQLRDLCGQCRELPTNDQPAIHSACLISLEADSSLRVFANHYTPDERFSSSCNTCSLSTPEDATCTHILVFPTPATTQSQHTNFNADLMGQNLGECEEFFPNLDDPDMPDEFDFGTFWNDGLLDGRDGAQPDSPGNRQSGFGTSSSMKNSNNMDMDDHHLDEPAQLSLQPLALAFYVSTAPTGPLPRWFWSNCPHMENTCPTFLKSALLIHTPFVQQNSDDLLHSNNRDCHSLDSSLTTDVLRYALEYYNSLSWLILDPSTNDRMSCLPMHIQVMMQLYHTLQAFT